jgi:RIO kinase 1
MASGLEHLLSEGIVSEVVGRLKSGKEADVYAVNFGGRVVAAKVYKDRAHRSFKNNAAYQEGRSVRNSRSRRAMGRKTSFGVATAEAAWKSAEADALYTLHAAEVRVPTPVLFLEGVLLMELVLDDGGDPAPRLIDATLTVGQANAAYHDMLTQLVRILACDLIHGDLSPYNVLWAAKGPTIIDFPQIISASHNSSSEAFFLRDARNILGYFASIDRSLQARSGDAVEIWRAYVRRELTPEFIPVGRSRPEAPRPRSVELQRQRPPNREGRPRTHNGEAGGASPVPHGRGPSGQGGGRRNPQKQPRNPQGVAKQQQGVQPSSSRAPLPPRNGQAAGPRPPQRDQPGGPGSLNERARGGQAQRASKPDSARSAHNPSPPRRPHVPEVIVRIARSPRPMADGEPRQASSTPAAATDPKPQDTSQHRPRSRG